MKSCVHVVGALNMFNMIEYQPIFHVAKNNNESISAFDSSKSDILNVADEILGTIDVNDFEELDEFSISILDSLLSE